MNSNFEMHQNPRPQNTSSSAAFEYFPVNPNPNPFFQQHHFMIQPFFDPVRDNNVDDNNNNSDNMFLPLSFKLGSGHENGGGGGGGGDGLVRRGCHGGWENREDSADFKQRFWKPLTTEFPNGNHDEECQKETEEEKREQKETSQYNNQETDDQKKRKYGFFEGSELIEAIYPRADVAEAAHQTASVSALTSENTPVISHSNVPAVNAEAANKGRKKRKSWKDDDDECASMEEFFESLVKRLMDHQEELNNKFLETIERLERERVEREEAWRQQELANLEREAKARANQRALASSREDTILSYLEKITGQKIGLPLKETQSRANDGV